MKRDVRQRNSTCKKEQRSWQGSFLVGPWDVGNGREGSKRRGNSSVDITVLDDNKWEFSERSYEVQTTVRYCGILISSSCNLINDPSRFEAGFSHAKADR